MNKHQLPGLPSAGLNWGAIQIAGLYLLVGGLWILFSDQFAARIALNQQMLTTISLYKGWGYVLVTALALYWLINLHTSRLKQSEESYKLLAENITDVIWVLDLETSQFRYVSPSVERLRGYTAREVLTKSMSSSLTTDSAHFLEKILPERIKEFKEGNDRTYIDEIEQPHKNGSTVWTETTTRFVVNKDSRHLEVYGVSRDISERKQVEKELRRWADAFEGCAHGLAIGDPDTNRIVVCNPAFAAMHKCRVEDIVGSAILGLYAPSDHEHVRRNVQKADQIGHSRFEAQMRRRDRTTFPVQMDLVSVLGEDGNVLHRVATAQDISERKQAEEAVRNSQAQITGIINSAMNAIISTDADQNISIFNPAAEAMFRCAQSEAVGQPLDRFIPERFRKAHRQHIRNFGQTGITNRAMKGSAVVLGRRSNGEEFPCEASISQIEIAGEKIYTVILRDVTERKQAEEYLRRFELLSEHSRDIILFIDRENVRILEANAAAMQAYGYSRDELLALTIWDLRASHTQNLTAEQLAQADAGGVLFETVHRRKDGTTFPVEVSSQGATIGGVRSLISIVRDITERKETEKALQAAHDELELRVQERTAALSEANALLQALMDNMPDHIYFKDLQSHFIRNSRSQANLLGLKDPAEVVGKTDFDFFPHAAKAYAEEQEVMRSGKPLVDFEEWVVWPDGREMWVSTTKVPLRNAEGQTIGIFGISHDITERKHTEQAIRQLNVDLENQAAQLQAANKELEAFSYSVSHDLRAPLRAIDGYTRILVEDYEAALDAEGKRICGIISAEARRMGQLIDDLLAFSRLGRKQMFSSKIDMRALVDSVFADLVKEQGRERIDFQMAKLPSIKGDLSLLRQVWVNLLSNAIKFTSKKERAVIEVGCRHSKDENIYYVRDNGAGFDMEYADKLFGVFQRLHGESEFEGTGVGLAIVQRIIRRHGGRVWAEGEVDKGATFYFALPRKENHS